MYCVWIHTCENFASEQLLQRKHTQGVDRQKRFMKLFQYLVSDVFLGVEFESVVIICVSLVLKADAGILYPLIFVVTIIKLQIQRLC